MNPSTSGPHPDYSNRDLIELAQLDALGLLDEGERQAFERSFRTAPASIQQLVRDSQSRATQLDSLLPDVQAPASLRERVLAAVAAAVRSESRQPEVAGRLTPAIARSTSVAPFWRAAAIGSIAAALLFGVVTIKLYTDFQAMNNTVYTNALADKWLKEFSPKFEHMLTNEKTQFVQFSPATASARGSALMMVDGEAETAQFFAKDLPQIEGGYTLALVDSSGNVVKTLARIDAQSSRSVNQFANFKVNPGETFALRSVAEQQTVLKSNNL
jgi:hypothetical protein